jgi:hypothetical protein
MIRAADHDAATTGRPDMAESPFRDPIDIATALHELASFLRSAGFPEAGALVAKAAQSAATQVERVHGKIELLRMNQNQQPAPKP